MSFASRTATSRREHTASECNESNQGNRYSNIRNQQYRLFLLQHASKCTAKDGKCKYTYCLEMKDILEHIAYCNDSHCNVKHCRNSRLLVNHSNSCEDEECVLCTPVREKMKDEHWAGVKKKLLFDVNEEFVQGTKRKLTF